MKFNLQQKVFSGRKVLTFFILGMLSLTSTGVRSQLWESLGIRTDHPPTVFYSDTATGMLYMGGIFQHVNGIRNNGLISYDGITWDSVGANFPGYESNAIVRFQGDLFVGGAFSIARFDGNQWTNTYVNGGVNALLAYEGKLIVAGGFDSIGMLSIHNLAAFDGQNWSDFHGSDTILNSSICIIKALEVYDGKLVVAGNIDQLGPMKEILQWDGQTWNDLSGGVGGGGFVFAMDVETYHDELYVAGYFDESDGSPGNRIARWNGTEWNRLGDGVGPGQANRLLVFDDKLHVAGPFSYAGGIPVDHLATWDGSQWCGFAGGLDGSPNTMCDHQGQLHIGGGFASYDGDSLWYTARWIGGDHTDTCSQVMTNRVDTGVLGGLKLVPNPAVTDFRIMMPDQSGMCTFSIRNLAGKLAASEGMHNLGESRVDITGLPSGIYFVEVKIGNRSQMVKLVKQ